jgi:hypothetical protein
VTKKLRLKAGPMVDALFEDNEYLNSTLDEAESRAGLVMNASFGANTNFGVVRPTQKTVVSWRAIGMEARVAQTGSYTRIAHQVQAPFKAHWLVVSTPGFQILRLMVNHEYVLLENVDADLFLWSNWDALKGVDMLDRVRIADTRQPWDARTVVYLDIEARPQLVAFKDQWRPFRAMILGEELTLRPA